MSRLSNIFDDLDSDGDMDAGEAVSSYKYLGLGQIVEEDNGAAKLTYLDSNGDVTGLDRFGRIVDQVWKNASDQLIDEYTYTYDRAGNRLTKSNELNHDLDESYVYDDVDRLKEWYVGGSQTPSETWNLDSLGNNLDAGSYNAANEETPDVGSSDYDAAGNMITLRSGNSAIYDAWNRLTKVTTGSGENLTILQQNVYDGANRRIQIFTNFSGSTPGTVADDYFSGQQVIETRQDAAVKYQYLWSPRYIDAPILRDTYSSGSIVAADRIFYLGDANYNVTGLVKYNAGTEEWEVVERYTYTPYGVVTARAGDTWNAIAGNVSQENNTILYTGRSVDLATGGLQNVDLAAGLMYYRARFYDAALERFINRDPIGCTMSDRNLYRYARNDPLEFVDPLGMAAQACCEFTNSTQIASFVGGLPNVFITINYPDHMDPKTACELAGQTGAARLLNHAGSFVSVTAGPCKGVVKLDPGWGTLAPPSVENPPIVNLCKAGPSHHCNVSGASTDNPPATAIAPVGPIPGHIPGQILLDQTEYPAGGGDIYMCRVWGCVGVADAFTDPDAFNACVERARNIMRQAALLGHFNQFSRGCTALANCYRRYSR